ncbi:DNA primase [Helicobacter saguini]|uniref:DNA primase n=1 Tax=Helicobacter saguini TaxID=1548018 RepID=A0A347VPD4_9HELI|nr:DNA primase [Helicobacter saguini]MWV61409.1 DNA primase [Helicobacter saguini]MWV67921.1 DNA primase [Helicobacter saguini]MWV70611.1 DNA primase [Helicobacter saguini]MWV72516.1 DNA primase [Helicobacter saguini]TLD94742.1 DNA primase [Helicobacter saguini]
MARITSESIERLKGNIDIVELISSYIDVKKAGRDYVALCPFHDEKTPSFSISATKGMYHCFGCGASGSGITFVMEYEHLEFVPAVEKIAKMFNVQLNYEAGSTPIIKSEIMPAIANFYHNNLFKHQEILAYLKQRKISLDSIKKFEIGYSGKSFETLAFLDKNNFTHKEAIEYGILGEKESQNYAWFRERVMFPIYNKNGVIVGFGGRIVEPKENVGKYINSRQSKIFNKSNILYGYNFAKIAVGKENTIIICEGYLDVIMLHQAGFYNAVATLGTGFTQGHLNMLSREKPRVLMCFDGDNAGIAAALRAAKMLSQASFDGGVVLLNDAKDPADMVALGKIAEFKIALNNAKSFVEFVLEQIISNFNISNPMQKEAALNAVLEFYHTLTPIVQDAYKRRLAQLLDIDSKHIKVSGGVKVAARTQFSHSLRQDSNNFAEETILINMLENKEHFFFALDYLSEKYFRLYADEFSLITQGKSEDSKIYALRFKSNAHLLNNEDFREQVRLFILQYAQNALRDITQDSNLNAEAKLALITQMKHNILRLQNGEILSV